jgi:hypothetical protein
MIANNTATRPNFLTRALPFAVAALTLAAVAGCKNSKKPEGRVDGAAFRPQGETRTVNKFVETQVSAGSRKDGTLRAFHFDRENLNSLGRKKLEEMVRDDDAAVPLIVYLDITQDKIFAERQASVQEFLGDRGLNASQMRVVSGPNLDNMGPTGPALRAKKALDSGTAGATNPEPTGSPSNAPGGH